MGGHLQLLHQPAYDVFLEGALQGDVEDADAGMFGGEPLDAPDALLDDHGVPGQVVVHQHIGDLKIDALRSRFGRYDHMTVGRILPEARDGVLVALPGRAVDDSDLKTLPFEEGLNGRLCLDPPGEHHHPPALGVLARQLTDERAEPLELRARLHTAHDAADRRGEVLRHGAVPGHVGELRHQSMWTAGERLEDADLCEPV